MQINPNSLAAANAVGIQNQKFATGAQVIARKILIIGTYNPANTAVVPSVPVQIFSDADAGNQFGYGYMLHRLAYQAFKGSQGVETWVIPQAETQSAAASAGSIDFTSSTGVKAGTLALYFAGLQVLTAITDSMTPTNIVLAIVAAMTAIKELPVAGAADGSTPGKINITAKSKGPWGDKIDIEMNLLSTDVAVTGIAATIVAMTGGTGVPTIATALAALGTGDGQNEKGFTDVIHGYLQDSTTLTAFSTYNGPGNDLVGNYAQMVERPFRALTGDTVVQSAGLAALIIVGNNNKTDRTNGIIGAPGSPNHPSEIAALAMGIMARINSTRAEQGYIDEVLPDILPGTNANRWTTEYANRDNAVKAGISTTMAKNGVLTMQNMVTFYHPDNVASSSNGYRAMRNISIIQNIYYNSHLNFEQDKWKGISIVSDKRDIGNAIDAEKARDLSDVIDDLCALADAFAGLAWLFESDYSKSNLSVTLRQGLTGFDYKLPVIFSGEGGIFNGLITFDISISILTQ